MKKNSNENVIFGKRLQEFRKNSGLSVAAISKELGVAKSTYREWEYGRAITGLPYPRLAQFLGVDLYELFGIEPIGDMKRPIKAATLQKLHRVSHLVAEVLAEL